MMGFPIRTSKGITLLSSSPWLFATMYVLRRLFVPRHPPYALIFFRLFFFYSVFKDQI